MGDKQSPYQRPWRGGAPGPASKMLKGKDLRNRPGTPFRESSCQLPGILTNLSRGYTRSGWRTRQVAPEESSEVATTQREAAPEEAAAGPSRRAQAVPT